MLTVHHLANSRSQRVIWLLEELGLTYTIVSHNRPSNTRQSSPSLTKLHPLGKYPILADGAVVLAETGAIFEYLMSTYAGERLQPVAQTAERIQYIYWRHFCEGSLIPYLTTRLVFAGVVQKSPWPLKPVPMLLAKLVGDLYLNPNLLACLNAIEGHLQTHRWFAGEDFSAADILLSFPLEALSGRMAPVSGYPHIAAFVERIRNRPAYLRAMEKGGWCAADFECYWAFLKPSRLSC